MSEDENVGYKNPPKRTQFRPGQSGNPKGRKKDQHNLTSHVKSVMRKSVTIREDGEQRHVTRQEALLLSLFEKAVRGNVKASSQILTLLQRTEAREPPHQEPPPVTANDRVIIDNFIQRHLAGQNDDQKD